MKTDMTVEQLVSKVNDLSLIKRDYCVDANKLVVYSDCMGSKLCIGERYGRVTSTVSLQKGSLTSASTTEVTRIVD